MSFAQAALNYKTEREHARNSFGPLPQGYCKRKPRKSWKVCNCKLWKGCLVFKVLSQTYFIQIHLHTTRAENFRIWYRLFNLNIHCGHFWFLLDPLFSPLFVISLPDFDQWKFSDKMSCKISSFPAIDWLFRILHTPLWLVEFFTLFWIQSQYPQF